MTALDAASRSDWTPAGAARRRGAVCAVLLGHAALVLLAWQARRVPVDAQAWRPSAVLRIVPAPPPRAVPERRWLAEVPALRPPPLAFVPPGAVPSSPGSDSLSPGPAAPPVDGAGRVGAAAGAAASGGRGLDLKPSAEVLRGALVNPATLDPRSNSPKPTFEERIAMGLDPSLCVKLERDADGTVRRRMGRLGRAQSQLQSTHGVGARGLLVCE